MVWLLVADLFYPPTEDSPTALVVEIVATPQYLIAESDPDLAEALKRFEKQSASVTFTDCIVMALADRVRIKIIFGFDEVFRKNGYRLPAASDQQEAA